MRNTQRENYWRPIVARQEKSGLSVKAFCRQEGLCPHTLYIWRRKFAENRAVEFAVVNVTSPTPLATAPANLFLRGGECLQIPAGFDAATLRTILGALQERA